MGPDACVRFQRLFELARGRSCSPEARASLWAAQEIVGPFAVHDEMMMGLDVVTNLNYIGGTSQWPNAQP